MPIRVRRWILRAFPSIAPPLANTSHGSIVFEDKEIQETYYDGQFWLSVSYKHGEFGIREASVLLGFIRQHKEAKDTQKSKSHQLLRVGCAYVIQIYM